MGWRIKGWPVEVLFAAAMVGVMLVLSFAFGLPIRMPANDLLIPLGVTYLVPLLGAAIYSIYAFARQRRTLIHELAISLPCYWIVLIVYFNLKLWTPFVNPVSFDAAFWSVDQALRPLVDLCIAIRKGLSPIAPYELNLYLTGFLLLFYISFLYHSVRTPLVLRSLIVSAMFLQGFGALMYLALPAIGPFIYEAGASPTSAAAQQMMLDVRNQSVANGIPWLSAHASQVLMAGLGAMPSLHVGYAYLFLHFSVRHARVLLPTYIPLFSFILITSVANRWHYLIDLPVGIALAVYSIRLATRFGKVTEAPAAAPAPHPAQLAAD